jgi:hypothetical protein
LIDILVIGIRTMLCAVEFFNQMEDFNKPKENWLTSVLELRNSISGRDTLNGLFAVLSDLLWVQHYERLRNLAALVMAKAYFAATWPGYSLKLVVLGDRVMKRARCSFSVPESHCYALADGIGFTYRACARSGLK